MMKNIFILLFSVIFLFSCKKTETAENEKKALNESIFLLDSKWENQDGKQLQLKDLKGKNLVMVMIFTSCKTACPLLVSDMKQVAKKIDKDKLK